MKFKRVLWYICNNAKKLKMKTEKVFSWVKKGQNEPTQSQISNLGNRLKISLKYDNYERHNGHQKLITYRKYTENIVSHHG